MMKTRLALAEIDAPKEHLDALLRLVGRGVFREKWPLSVCKRVLWALPAVAQSHRAPPPDAEKRRIYAAFASLLKPSIEAGWDLFYSWLNYLRPGAPFAQKSGGLTALNSRGLEAGGSQVAGGEAKELAAGGEAKEAVPCPFGSTNGETKERRFTSESLGLNQLGDSQAGKRCPMERMIDLLLSTNAGREYLRSLSEPLPNSTDASSPETSEPGSSLSTSSMGGSGTTLFSSGSETSRDFWEWLKAEHPFTWTLIIRDRAKLDEARRKWAKPSA
jgi:hypothetical protein